MRGVRYTFDYGGRHPREAVDLQDALYLREEPMK